MVFKATFNNISAVSFIGGANPSNFIAMTITTMMAPWWSYNRGDYCNKFTRFLPIFYGHLRHLIPLNLIPTKYPRKTFLESVVQNVTVGACRYYVVISGIFHHLTFSPRHTREQKVS